MELDKPNLSNMLIDINTQVASFRDMLIHIGHDKHDCPELRAQIRKTRRACVESCIKVAKSILPQLKSDSEITATPILDNPHLILLFYLTQLFLRELVRSYHLLKIIPMDMSGYFDSSAVGPSNLGNVISQLLLCKQINPDFHSEELCSITKDSQEIAKLLAEMQEYMPKQEAYLERNEVLKDKNSGPWPAKRRRAALYRNMGLLCCISRQHPNYL
ncbi:CLUMA_CG004262, isoform A [Clunio marinus]|uniref:CLUMA_CG004262, isoform A n=1 Tax=Clunio marinus TaxID=568069 RepID=A0A1J1HR90_9DIPT|nr:CLUMA_CG004262, isoform A [Clunio marinus]